MRVFFCRFCEKEVETPDHYCPVCHNLLTARQNRMARYRIANRSNIPEKVVPRDDEQTYTNLIDPEPENCVEDRCTVKYYNGSTGKDRHDACLWTFEKAKAWTAAELNELNERLPSDMAEWYDEIVISTKPGNESTLVVRIITHDPDTKCDWCHSFRHFICSKYLLNGVPNGCPRKQPELCSYISREELWGIGGLGCMNKGDPGLFFLGSFDLTSIIHCKWAIEIPDKWDGGKLEDVGYPKADLILKSRANDVHRYTLSVKGHGYDGRCKWCKEYRRQMMDGFRVKYRKMVYKDGACKFDSGPD